MEKKSNLLELRRRIKKKKPYFTRQCSHKIKEISSSYRKPKGLHSKQRTGEKGNKKKIQVGYGSPKEVKEKSRTGLSMTIVNNSLELEKLDKEKDSIIIAKGVGDKKRIQIMEKAKEKGITVLNIKDIESIKKKFEERTKEKKEKRKEEEKKKEEKKKQAEKKEGLAKKVEKEAVTEEEKKKEEKKERDKILTKKDS